MMFVSSVVPVFNSIKTLERAINSLLIQEKINEIFIVDDGSTDGSFELGLKLKEKYSIVEVLNHQNRENRGASASRNLGLSYCSNNWIQFLDADDELISGKINHQLNAIGSDTSLVVGPFLWESKKGKKKCFYDENIWNGLLVAQLGITSSNLWNKELIDKVGGWPEHLINTQEYDLLFRICKFNSNVAFSKEFLTIVHVTPNSLTRSNKNVIPRLINQYNLRKEILSFIENQKKFVFNYRLNFAGYIGTMLRNNNNIINLEYSRFHYFLFKARKSILDRINK